MLIGILNCGYPPEGLAPEGEGYDPFFERLLAGQGFDFAVWNAVDLELPPGPEAADGWLITGSRHGAYDDLPFIAPLEALIRDIREAGRPLVGICFGHQIIAQALGGRVEKFSQGWAVGRSDYDWQGETLTLNAWHQDQVTERPAEAEVLASSTFCENAALLYGTQAFTVQAHPEYGSDFIAGLIRTRGRGTVDPGLLDRAERDLDKPLDNARLAQMIGRFFRTGAPTPAMEGAQG